MDTSSFEIVGHYSICTGEVGEFEINDILKDKEFNYWYKEGSEIVKYPWESRILDATQVWTNADCYQDNTLGKWIYRCIPYDGLIFTLEANSMTELVELIRDFVEPPVEVFEELIKSQNYTIFVNFFEKESKEISNKVLTEI